MTAHRNFLKWAAAATVASAALLGASAAQARSDVFFNVGVSLPPIGLSIGNAPVYYNPPPVYYAPPPVYYRPAPVYYQAAPVYYQPRVYGHGHGHGWRGHDDRRGGGRHNGGYDRAQYGGGHYR